MKFDSLLKLLVSSFIYIYIYIYIFSNKMRSHGLNPKYESKKIYVKLKAQGIFGNCRKQF